jgi:hypothetical protein
LNCTPYTLRRHCAKAGAKRFRTLVTTEISKKNKEARIQYGQLNEAHTLLDFWQYIWFTDEVHFLSASLQNKPEYKLRYPGQKQRLEAIREEKTSRLKVTVHVAAGISYNHKGPLIFYKDPEEPSEKALRGRRPRKYKHETPEDFQNRLQSWEQSQPEAEVLPKGNDVSRILCSGNLT